MVAHPGGLQKAVGDTQDVQRSRQSAERVYTSGWDNRDDKDQRRELAESQLLGCRSCQVDRELASRVGRDSLQVCHIQARVTQQYSRSGEEDVSRIRGATDRRPRPASVLSMTPWARKWRFLQPRTV